MTPTQITLVQTSFAQVRPAADMVATLFYNRLFELAPELRALFQGDMTEQRRKLMMMLSVVVNGLNRLEDLLPTVADLGRRHARYGVQEAHYALVGAALLWTLEQGLGAAFTPEVETAWATAYRLLADTMQAGTRVARIEERGMVFV